MSNLTSSFIHASLGRYEIQEHLGTGGMARVYKAWDKNLERAVAIKILHEHLAEAPTFKERFEREAKFVASFNHPNIVQVYDFDAVEIDARLIYYMVMRFIPGRSLDSILRELAEKEERLRRDQVRDIMLNLTDALAYAHERGMIHRDVKPSNILLDEREQAVLTDFGIARLAQGSNLTQEGITIGTPAYMSPEQAAGEAVDSRTDIYALGVILYELLTGQQPFHDDGSLSILLKHLNAPVPSLSEHLHVEDPHLDAVIFRAMAKDPADRYPTAQAFADDLTKAFSGAAVAPPPVSTRRFAALNAAGDGPTTLVKTPAPFPTLKKPRQNAPLGIFAVGIGLVALALLIGLLSQQMKTDETIPQANSEVESMVEPVDSMTGPAYFTSTFSPSDAFNNHWPQGESSAVIRQISAEGYYEVRNLRPGTAITTVFDPSYIYDKASISMSARLEEISAPASGYGIVFRYQDEDHYNVFAVDGMGRFSIWVREAGVWRELRGLEEKWTPDPSIHPLGEENDLNIDILGDTLKGYVNGQEVVSVTDSTLSAGSVGIYLATTSRETAALQVDSYQVTEAVSSADSMTGE